MVDPYKMVLISICTSFTIIAGVVYYRYIFPKKKINFLFLVILFSIPPLVSILRPGVYESGDFTIHIYRSIAFYESLSQGNFLPSWASGLNATYGYPLFIFNYPLPYYIVSFFHFLGFSFIASMKLFLISNFLFSGIGMFLCAKKLLKYETAAFTAAIFYQFSPYHLIDLHFKNVIGEILLFTLLPFVFFSLQKLWEKKTGVWFAITSLSIALLIMSHVVLALFAMILFCAYAFLFSQQIKKPLVIFQTLASFTTGAIASVYIWATPFFLTKYTITAKILEQVKDNSYLHHVTELLFAPWRLGLLFQGPQGEISLLIGYTQLFVILVAIFLLLKKQFNSQYRPFVLFWIVSFFILVFCITTYSKIFWESIPFLSSTGGSHRLLLLISFACAIVAGYVSISLAKRQLLLVLLIACTIFITILNWGQRRVIPSVTDTNLIQHLWKSTSETEAHWYANSKWRSVDNQWFSELPKTHLQITKGKAEIKELQRLNTQHTYTVNADTMTTLRENTLYFPGWQVIDNGAAITTTPDSDGVIQFKLNKGLHYIKVVYRDVSIYALLKTISSLGFLILLGYLIFDVVRRFFRRK